MLNAVASVLAAAAGIGNGLAVVGGLLCGSTGGFGEGRVSEKHDSQAGKEVKMAQKDSEDERRWVIWKGGRTAHVLMMAAWIVGTCGYWVMWGRSKEGQFSL